MKNNLKNLIAFFAFILLLSTGFTYATTTTIEPDKSGLQVESKLEQRTVELSIESVNPGIYVAIKNTSGSIVFSDFTNEKTYMRTIDLKELPEGTYTLNVLQDALEVEKNYELK
ncbi:MAG: hypothetical protein JJT94_09490 [Bernardetiaceae bacterium]|nr:hypothetical protein [Bernardetiaceae bacterium]